MNMDALAPLDLSLGKAKNQRATKDPLKLGFEITCCIEVIKKIQEWKLPFIEAMVIIENSYATKQKQILHKLICVVRSLKLVIDELVSEGSNLM